PPRNSAPRANTMRPGAPRLAPMRLGHAIDGFARATLRLRARAIAGRVPAKGKRNGGRTAPGRTKLALPVFADSVRALPLGSPLQPRRAKPRRRAVLLLVPATPRSRRGGAHGHRLFRNRRVASHSSRPGERLCKASTGP